jgi:hypothetical protein
VVSTATNEGTPGVIELTETRDVGPFPDAVKQSVNTADRVVANLVVAELVVADLVMADLVEAIVDMALDTAELAAVGLLDDVAAILRST